MTVSPWQHRETRRTGNIRFRIGAFKRVVLQIQVEISSYQHFTDVPPNRKYLTWRDAVPEDLQYIDFQPGIVRDSQIKE